MEKIVKEHYTGNRARSYDSGRNQNPKWKLEHKVVEDFIANNTDIETIIDAPLGTNRFGTLFQRNSYVKEVHGYELSSDMIIEAKKIMCLKLKIHKHDLVNDYIKEKCQLSIIMRMLNLFEQKHSLAILKNVLDATEEYSILSLRYWEEDPKLIQNKITIQNFNKFNEEIRKASFKIIDERKHPDTKGGQYSIFTLKRV